MRPFADPTGAGTTVASSPLILVIADAEDSREACARYLRFKGRRVATANDGRDGLGHAFVLRPDAIVLDLGLPGLDGWEVARRLKDDPRTSRIPLIALTGHAGDAMRARALEAGVDSYLVKPCPPDLLMAEIARCIAGLAH